jgi:hypothetical protein
VQVSPAAQTTPHAPQLLVSDDSVTHALPHRLSPVGHAQVPATHDWAAGQTAPHAPQLLESVSKLVQTEGSPAPASALPGTMQQLLAPGAQTPSPRFSSDATCEEATVTYFTVVGFPHDNSQTPTVLWLSQPPSIPPEADAIPTDSLATTLAVGSGAVPQADSGSPTMATEKSTARFFMACSFLVWTARIANGR